MLLAIPLVCSLFTFGFASPIPEQASTAAGAPGVDQLNHVSTQLANLLQEIANYEGGQFEAQQIFTHASEALKTLDEASTAMQNGPYIDIATATQYTPIALQLSNQVRTLADTLKSNKKVITASGLGANVYQILDITHSEASHLFKVFASKTNAVFRPVITGWENLVIASIADARTTFRAYAPVTPYPTSGTPAAPATQSVPFQWEQGQQAQPYLAPPQPQQPSADQQAFAQQPYYAPQPYYQPQPYYPQPYPNQAPPPGYAWTLAPISDPNAIPQGQGAPPAPAALPAPATPAAPAPSTVTA